MTIKQEIERQQQSFSQLFQDAKSNLSPLLTDQYQYSMVYTYFCAGIHNKNAVFDVFFRKSPFDGSYAVLGGIDEVVDFIVNFKFTDEEINFIMKALKVEDKNFENYLKTLNYKMLTIRAPKQGTIVFPREPVMTIEGPLALCQIIETTILVLINYATLIATNACRMRVAVSPIFTQIRVDHAQPYEVINQALNEKSMLEFGLRRAQGPNGGMTASKYAIIGGFNGTSNVLAAQQLGILPAGTIAHAFILSQTHTLKQIVENPKLLNVPKNQFFKDVSFNQFAERVLQWKEMIFSTDSQPDFMALHGKHDVTPNVFISYRGNEQELAAFTLYSYTQPHNVILLIDTYDTLFSGLINFLIVGCCLIEFGFQPLGVRLDSGDLAYLSIKVHECYQGMDSTIKPYFQKMREQHPLPNIKLCRYDHQFANCKVSASNDINENILVEMNKNGAKIDMYGIGTHLVTCQKQPALGGVYKLCEIDGVPRMKMTEELQKSTLPGNKQVYRLYLQNGEPYVDLIQGMNEKPPQVNQIVTCIHPSDQLKRVQVIPSRVERLLNPILEKGKIHFNYTEKDGKIEVQHEHVYNQREYVLEQLYTLRADHKRFINPTPYKVSLSVELDKQVRDIALNCRQLETVK